MRKILVCGSAGFLMSNLMRYMLYRTKDYEFASVDCLKNFDFRKVYQHRKHSFHIGDAGDAEFMDRMIWMEKPDILVIGTMMSVPPISKIPESTDGINEIVLPTSIACRYASKGFSNLQKRPKVIRLVPDTDVPDMGNRKMWNFVESMVVESGGKILRLPTCFGNRGNGWFEDALRRIAVGKMEDGWSPSCEKRRYAYADDVASMIWFMAENDCNNIIKMPALFNASPMDMLLLSQLTGTENTDVVGWCTDSNDAIDVVRKTTKWHMMNKWVFERSVSSPLWHGDEKISGQNENVKGEFGDH